jgi:hypothetical protein
VGYLEKRYRTGVSCVSIVPKKGTEMAYLKQSEVARTKKKRETKKANHTLTPERVVVTGPDTGHMPSSSMQHDINHVAGLDGVEQSLDWIARSLSHLTSDEHAVSLSVGQGSNTNPIKLTLSDNDYEDTMDRLVTSFERIADSVAMLAGFSRPRLEHWHEQAEYTPQYRDSACDGGTPGPKVACELEEGKQQ